MSKILIIGKTSYIGLSLKAYFDKKHSDVIVELVSSRNYEWINSDFSQYDVVFNVSGLCHADSKHGTYETYMEVNGDLPVEMAKKAKVEGVKMFINMSSMIVYGNMSCIGVDKKIDATTNPSPVNTYGESKLKAEQGLQKLTSDHFKVALIRAPLVYGENAKDNFPRLVRYAMTIPIFPNIQNCQSMIYIDNLCELVYLIMERNQGGIYLPQDENYICTSQLVRDVANASGKKMYLTKVFNPLITLLSKKIYFLNKVFGNITYDLTESNYFDNMYRVVDYDVAIQRIVTKMKDR